MREQVWAQNAVVAKDDGHSVEIRPRCPECGYVSLNNIIHTSASKGLLNNLFARCDECGKNFKIVVSRG